MPPQGGDPPCVTLQSGPSELQSTPPHGRRRLHQPAPLYGFNPRLRTGGDGASGGDSAGVYGFNPRLRTGGDDVFAAAPKRPASFNPRLRTGGDGERLERDPAERKFQSTPPHGRRHAQADAPCVRRGVSIHASAREATNPVALLGCTVACFNPRLRTGGDGPSIACAGPDSWVSIHASAREATRGGGPSQPQNCRFNPRLRTGGDADR